MRLDFEGAGELPGADPTGFLGQCNFVHKRILGGVTGFLSGGPLGALKGVISGGGSPAPTVLPRRPQSAPPGTGFVQAGTAVVRAPGLPAAIARALPGGRTGLEVAGAPAGMKIACHSGYHANKSDYWLKDGSFVAKGTRCVRNRRRNPMNPRALSRAISRVDSGKALQGRLAEITTAKWTGAGKRK